MPIPKKKCPKCGDYNAIGRRVCGNTSCGHKFAFKPKKKRAAKMPPSGVALPEFACGHTTDGGVFLYWPQREESLILTASEAKLLMLALAARYRLPQDTPA